VSPVTNVEVPNAAKEQFKALITAYSDAMYNELIANYPKKGDRSGWINDNPKQLVKEIYYHTAKLQKAVCENDTDGVVEYGADLGNLAGMVIDICISNEIKRLLAEEKKHEIIQD
jgi:hypothetical protein